MREVLRLLIYLYLYLINFFKNIRSFLGFACTHINNIMGVKYDWLRIKYAGKISSLCSLFYR